MEVEATPQRRAQQQPCKNGVAKQLPGGGAKPLRHNPLLVINFLLMPAPDRRVLLLLAPLGASFLSRRRSNKDGGSATPLFLMSPRLLAAVVAVGLMTGLDDILYAYGLAYLPVSTSSILISTQLAFTAAFALLLVRQRFTAFSVNAVVLLSVGAAMLGMNAGGDRPAGVTRS
ncbi:hypothetical protein ZWY2020_038360 [Hordeum vulgare]|nr:hypothetical protein ZWY2020_038360 [Hordeum vulgare]